MLMRVAHLSGAVEARVDAHAHSARRLVEALLLLALAAPPAHPHQQISKSVDRMHECDRTQHPFASGSILDLDARVAERLLDELAHRVLLAGADHEVFGLRLLQDEPHGLHVVLRRTAPMRTNAQNNKCTLYLHSYPIVLVHGKLVQWKKNVKYA